MATSFRIVLYGLIAAASPLALAATLVVLKTHRARLNGLIFATTFLVGETVVLVVVVALGSIAAPGKGGSGTAAAVVELALGAVLVGTGWHAHRRPARDDPPSEGATGRTAAVFARLAKITPKTAFGAGLLLGIGGPKRLTVTVVAASTIAAAGFTSEQEAVAGAVYVALGAFLVWAPVAIFVIAGHRSQAWLAAAEKQLLARQRTVAVVLLLVFGTMLLTDGLVRLVT